MSEENSEVTQKVKNKGGRPPKNDKIVGDLSQFDFDFDFKKKGMNAKERAYVRECAEILLVQGLTEWQVAKALSISWATANKWLNLLSDEKKAQIEKNELNSINRNTASFVNTLLSSMSRVAFYASQEEYVNNHKPNELAELFDSMANNTFRLIEANQRAQLAMKEIEARQRPNYLPAQPQQQSNNLKEEKENIQEGELTNAIVEQPIWNQSNDAE